MFYIFILYFSFFYMVMHFSALLWNVCELRLGNYQDSQSQWQSILGRGHKSSCLLNTEASMSTVGVPHFWHWRYLGKGAIPLDPDGGSWGGQLCSCSSPRCGPQRSFHWTVNFHPCDYLVYYLQGCLTLGTPLMVDACHSWGTMTGTLIKCPYGRIQC